MQTVTIEGREYKVEAIETGPNLAADLERRGWEPQQYMATGKRGAVKMAYHSRLTGEWYLG